MKIRYLQIVFLLIGFAVQGSDSKNSTIVKADMQIGVAIESFRQAVDEARVAASIVSSNFGSSEDFNKRPESSLSGFKGCPSPRKVRCVANEAIELLGVATDIAFDYVAEANLMINLYDDLDRAEVSADEEDLTFMKCYTGGCIDFASSSRANCAASLADKDVACTKKRIKKSKKALKKISSRAVEVFSDSQIALKDYFIVRNAFNDCMKKD